MTEFEDQVADAIAGVPHADDCGIIPGMPGGRVHECTCDRDQRVAVRTAAAIDRAVPFDAPRALQERRDLALAALRGEP